MEVQARDDRQPRAAELADATQQLAVGVVDVLRDHCAVQVEIDRVECAGLADRLDDQRAHALEGVARHVPRRLRLAPEQRHQLVAQARASWTKPATARLIPLTASKIASPCVRPGHASAASKSANVAFTGENVLVSCWKPATAMRAMTSP